MNTSRRVEVGRNTCFVGFNAGKQFVRSGVFDATSIEQNTGTNERQTVTITGTPTGGTFVLAFNGNSSTAIPYNADRDTLEAALESITGIKDGEAKVLGGPGPTSAFTVDFVGGLAHKDQSLLTLKTNNLTGGTSPSVTIAETTKGSDIGWSPMVTVGTYDLPGTLLMVTGKSPNSLKEWDGVSATAIEGILDGTEEFIGTTDRCNRQIAYYNNAGLVVDATKVKGYATNAANIKTWAASKGIQIING